MVSERAVVTSPATIANFGPGFDSFGLCLDSPVDKVSVALRDDGRIALEVPEGMGLPTEPSKNTCSFAATKLAEMCGGPRGFDMKLEKGTRPGSGLGSSAASSVGGALAMAALLGVEDMTLVLEASAMGEELVAGVRHYDNVAAALYGGFTAATGAGGRQVVRVDPPALDVVVVLPDIEVNTRDARAVLPRSVPLEDAVYNLSLASAMVDAMIRGDPDAIGRCLDDRLSVPFRKKLVPGFDEVRRVGLESGALGVSLAGSGPAIFAIAKGHADEIRLAMVSALERSAGLSCSSFLTVPGGGAKVLSTG